MAFAERAELVARLSLKDDFSGRLKGATSSLKGMEGSLGRIATLGKSGIASATANLAKLGAVGAGFVALNVKSGISSLAELEDATISVDGAIKQMGLTGKITSGEIAGWASEIEKSVQAAFDDKEITQAATTLLRFGKVAPESLKQTLTVMTDLAARTGSVESASSALAKALADPTKATRVLRQVGVSLTDVQEKQIKQWVEQGKLGKAQALILGEVERKVKGAAAAMKGPYGDALNILHDATEDAQRVLAEGFLPLLTRVADKLSTAVADPAFITSVREFGANLAGGFDKLIDIAGRIPWGQIGDSMKIAGAGAKVLFDAFTMLPPWVQTAVLTGWGLNKLTGGALSGIVGELGKGLIRGVLGMNAGVVNINAATVNGGGGSGGPGGLIPKAAGGTGFLSALAAGAGPILAAAMAPLVLFEFTKLIAGGDQAIIDRRQTSLDQQAAARGINRTGANPGGVPPRAGGGGSPKTQAVHDSALLAGEQAGHNEDVRSAATVARSIAESRDRMESRLIALKAATLETATATKIGDSSIRETIRANRPITNVNVTVRTSVSVGQVNHAMYVRNVTNRSHVGTGGGNSGGGANAGLKA